MSVVASIGPWYENAITCRHPQVSVLPVPNRPSAWKCYGFGIKETGAQVCYDHSLIIVTLYLWENRIVVLMSSYNTSA